MDHNRTVRSADEEAKHLSTGEKATFHTPRLCPVNEAIVTVRSVKHGDNALEDGLEGMFLRGDR